MKRISELVGHGVVFLVFLSILMFIIFWWILQLNLALSERLTQWRQFLYENVGMVLDIVSIVL